MYQKAMLPVDGSELSAHALEQVPRVLGMEGEALVVEVIDSVARILAQATPAGFALDGSGLTAEIAEQVVEAQRSAAEQHLADAKRRLLEAGLGHVETEILEGVPGPAIVERVAASGCDVVVMATHGRSGLTRTVLGSVADYVVRHLEGVPVVLVHPAHEAGRERREAKAVTARA
ncbi:MAG: universal stress protein [Chloroflexi bacterium]|nr:universal stress protein [Chloroflexota bacterium]